MDLEQIGEILQEKQSLSPETVQVMGRALALLLVPKFGLVPTQEFLKGLLSHPQIREVLQATLQDLASDPPPKGTKRG